MKLKGWQIIALDDFIMEKDIRKVHWYWGTGNIGKSDLADFISYVLPSVFRMPFDGLDPKTQSSCWYAYKSEYSCVIDLPSEAPDVNYTLIE